MQFLPVNRPWLFRDTRERKESKDEDDNLAISISVPTSNSVCKERRKTTASIYDRGTSNHFVSPEGWRTKTAKTKV